MDIGTLITKRLGSAAGFVGDALRNPVADRQATLLVLAAVVLVFGILALTVAIAIASARARTVARRARVAGMEAGVEITEEPQWAAGQFVAADEVPVAAAPRAKSGGGAKSALMWAAAFVLVFFVAWVAAGVSTAQDDACSSCHRQTPHSVVQGDPHRNVDCVSCHESGGQAMRLTLNVPERLGHYVAGVSKGTVPAYGQPSEAGCRTCHAPVLSGVSTNDERGLRVSHAEPLRAGARCLDCHRPLDGVIVADTVGMQPCLRCHDDVDASSECSTCHVSDPSKAVATGRKATASFAQRLIPVPDCGGCHSTASCNDCHRVQMPHTPEFKASGHAREAVVELWKDGGTKCQRCHTETRRPCTRCHEMPFLAHGEGFKEGHKAASWSGGCTCHERRAPIRGRNFCMTCHATKPPGAAD